MHWLIDGYNVMHQMLDRHDDLQAGRKALIDLAASSMAKRDTVTIVFDSRTTTLGLPKFPSTIKGIRIIFVPVADDYIIETLRDIDVARDVTVVSSDAEVKGYSGQLGARVLSAKQFLRLRVSPDDPSGREPAEKYR